MNSTAINAESIAYPEWASSPQEKWVWLKIIHNEPANLSQFPIEARAAHENAGSETAPFVQRVSALWRQVGADAAIRAVCDPWCPHDDGAVEWDPDGDDETLKKRLIAFEKPEILSRNHAASNHTDVRLLVADWYKTRPRRWPAWQTLSARFLRALLSVRAPVNQPPLTAIRVSYARVLGTLDCADQYYDCEIIFSDCQFEGDVRFTDVRLKRSLRLQGSRFLCSLNLQDSVIGGYVNLNDCFVNEKLTADYLQCTEGFYVKRSLIQKQTTLNRSRMGRHLEFQNSVLEGHLIGHDASIAGRLRGKGAIYKNYVDFQRANALGGLDFQDAVFDRHCLFMGASTESNLELQNAHFRSFVRFTGISVADRIFLSDAQFDGVTRFDNITTQGGVQLDGAIICSDFTFANSTLGRELILEKLYIPLGGTDTGSSAYTFKRVLWSSNTDIASSKKFPPKLILRDATVDRLVATLDSWRTNSADRESSFVEFDISGFEFKRFGEFLLYNGSTPISTSMASASTRQIKQWISAGLPEHRMMPGPHLVVSSALRSFGLDQKAQSILIARGHYRRSKEKNLFFSLGWILYLVTLGYGYRVYSRGVILILLSILIFFCGGFTIGLQEGGRWDVDWDEWLLYTAVNAFPGLSGRLEPLTLSTGELLQDVLMNSIWAPAFIFQPTVVSIVAFVAIAAATGWARQLGRQQHA